MSTLIVLLAYLMLVVQSHKTYRGKVPNGCMEIANSKALGHVNDVGGGANNVFGKAFKTAGFKWTTELCQADSDGDGQTNGFELGDPNCNWKEGEKAAITDQLSHPGKNTSVSTRTSRRMRNLGGGGHDHGHDDDKVEKDVCETTTEAGDTLKPTSFVIMSSYILLSWAFAF